VCVHGSILREPRLNIRLVDYESVRFMGVAESRVKWVALILTLLPIVLPEDFVIPKVTCHGTVVFCEPQSGNSESLWEGIRMVFGGLSRGSRVTAVAVMADHGYGLL
jgi:hypothetical protein